MNEPRLGGGFSESVWRWLEGLDYQRRDFLSLFPYTFNLLVGLLWGLVLYVWAGLWPSWIVFAVMALTLVVLVLGSILAPVGWWRRRGAG